MGSADPGASTTMTPDILAAAAAVLALACGLYLLYRDGMDG